MRFSLRSSSPMRTGIRGYRLSAHGSRQLTAHGPRLSVHAFRFTAQYVNRTAIPHPRSSRVPASRMRQRTSPTTRRYEPPPLNDRHGHRRRVLARTPARVPIRRPRHQRSTPAATSRRSPAGCGTRVRSASNDSDRARDAWPSISPRDPDARVALEFRDFVATLLELRLVTLRTTTRPQKRPAATIAPRSTSPRVDPSSSSRLGHGRMPCSHESA